MVSVLSGESDPMPEPPAVADCSTATGRAISAILMVFPGAPVAPGWPGAHVPVTVTVLAGDSPYHPLWKASWEAATMLVKPPRATRAIDFILNCKVKTRFENMLGFS